MSDTPDQLIESKVQDAFTRALTNFKGTFSFERKISRGEYSNSDSSTAAIHVQFDYAPDATPEEFLASASEAALQGRAVVYQELGIEAHLDAGGVLREVVNDAFPGATTETVAADPQDSNPARQQAAAVASVGDKPPYTDDQVKGASGDELKQMRRENADWAKARYETHPQEFKDNRPDNEKNGTKFPHFTHKKFWRAGFYTD